MQANAATGTGLCRQHILVRVSGRRGGGWGRTNGTVGAAADAGELAVTSRVGGAHAAEEAGTLGPLLGLRDRELRARGGVAAVYAAVGRGFAAAGGHEAREGVLRGGDTGERRRGHVGRGICRGVHARLGWDNGVGVALHAAPMSRGGLGTSSGGADVAVNAVYVSERRGQVWATAAAARP